MIYNYLYTPLSQITVSVKEITYQNQHRNTDYVIISIDIQTARCRTEYGNSNLYSQSRRTSYRKISWSLGAVGFGFRFFKSLWNLTGTTAAALPRCLSYFRAIRSLYHPISWLRDFTRSCRKTSYRLVNSGMFTAITNCPHLPHNYTAITLTNPPERRLFLIIVDLNARGTWWQIGLSDHIATQQQVWFFLVLIHRYPILK